MNNNMENNVPNQVPQGTLAQQNLQNVGVENVAPIQNATVPVAPVADANAALPNAVPVEPQLQQNAPGNLTQINNIPTVEQKEQDFLDNAQAISSEKVEEKKSGGMNYAFLIILFIIVLVAIFFVFPLLKK